MSRETPVSSGWRSVLAHGMTVLVTLILVAVLFGDRLGLRRPPLVQIRGGAVEAVPPAPQPVSPSARAVPGPLGGTGPRVAATMPPPPEDVLKGLDPDERNNILVYAAVNKSVVNITTEATESGFFGDETSTGSGSGFVIDKAGHVLTNLHVVRGGPTPSRSRSSMARSTPAGSSAPTPPTTWPC